ncbi:hypothetical protein NW765_014429 [Fusarium oxysporum]|nr:hypothetical protein NW765_014429 [Fusarium oxysporum]
MVYNEHPSRACAVCRPSWFKLRFRFNQQIANDEHLTAPLTIFTIPYDCQHVVESPNAGQLQTGAWNTSCHFSDDHQMTSTSFASRLPTRLGDPASSEGWSKLSVVTSSREYQDFEMRPAQYACRKLDQVRSPKVG